jgi:thiamine-phosphate pyrophosphorylase
MNDCQLYLISPPKIELADFAVQLEQAYAGGNIACFQLRLPGADDNFIKAAVSKLLPIVKKHQSIFIINEHAHLAKQLNVDGVHIGETSTIKPKDLANIRKELTDEMIIGASCYGSRDLAMMTADEGADYISFGSIFDSNTVNTNIRVDLETLKWWSEYTTIASVAIGGINYENCAQIIETGVNFIACISAIWDHKDGPKQAVFELTKKLRGYHEN